MENDDLARHLEALKRENCYRVDAVLKESACELTQRVFFVGDNGAETGPFIRKFIRQEPGMGGAYARIFEAQQAGRRFKHVPDVLECYARDGVLVVVMECVRGETLQETVYRQDPSLSLTEAVMPSLCDAVTELHCEFEPPIIHRDLKPSNIVLSQEGLAVIDFGIAREFKEGAENDTAHFGSRGFAPPEQFGFGQTSPRSDVYSLGMVLFFCLTETMPDSQARQRSFRDPRIPESMRLVVANATALDPAERFASAAELKAAFEQAAAQARRERAQAGAAGAAGTTRAPDRPNGRNETARASATDRPGETPWSTVNAGPTSKKPGAGVAGVEKPADVPQAEPTQSRRGIGVALALAACLAIGAIGAWAAIAQPWAATPENRTSVQEEQPSQEQGESVSAPSDSEDVQTASDQAVSSNASASSQEANDSGTDAAANTSASASVSEAVVADGLEVLGQPRAGFDPATNFAVDVAGATFQIPAYFKSRVDKVSDTQTRYYAEQGSSVAMLMTAEYEIDVGNLGAYDVQNGFDAYLSGVMKSGDVFAELVNSTSCNLAGCPARIAFFRGTVEGIPLKTKVVCFYDSDQKCLGSIMFGQTENAQFDYSDDFGKIVTSARPQ